MTYNLTYNLVSKHTDLDQKGLQNVRGSTEKLIVAQ